MIPPGPPLFNFNPHSPTATGRLVLFFTNSSVSPRSPPNSSPSSTCESLPPPPPSPSTRAALGIPLSLYGLVDLLAERYGWPYVLSRSPPLDFAVIVIGFDLMWWFGMRDMGRWFRLLPLPPWRRRSNRSWTAPSAPRPPTSGALSPTGASSSRYASAVHAWFLVRFVDCNDAPNVISQ